MKELKNSILDKEYFLQDMKIERVELKDVKGDIEYFLKAEYEILEIDENIVTINAKVKSGFDPAVMFKGKFNFDIRVDFENDISGENEIEEHLEGIFRNLGSEISYLVAICTKSMGGSPLIVPPLMVEYKKKEIKK